MLKTDILFTAAEIAKVQEWTKSHGFESVITNAERKNNWN